MNIITLGPEKFEISTENNGQLKFHCLGIPELFYLYDNYMSSLSAVKFAKWLMSLTFCSDVDTKKQLRTRSSFPFFNVSCEEIETFSRLSIEHNRFLGGRKDAYIEGYESIEEVEEQFDIDYQETKNTPKYTDKLLLGWKIYYQKETERRQKMSEVIFKAKQKRYPLYEKYTRILKEINWPPLYCFKNSQIQYIVNEYERINDRNAFKKDLADAIEAYFNSDHIHEYSQKWKTITWLNNRLVILFDCIEAHNYEKYNLSIPVLLSQIEGIIRDFYNNNLGNRFDIYMDKVLHKKYNKIPYKLFEFDVEVKKYFKSVLYKKDFQLNRDDNFLNRNSILHGINVTYGTKLLSIQVILLVDYIIHRIDALYEG